MKTITDHELSEIADDWAREMPIDIGRRASFAAGYRYAEQQVKNCNTPDVSTPFCPYCGKFKRMNDNGVMHQLCECTKW